MTEVSAFGVVQTHTTAMVCATWFLANVVTNKIAKDKPFGTRLGTVPMVSFWQMEFNYLWCTTTTMLSHFIPGLNFQGTKPHAPSEENVDSVSKGAFFRWQYPSLAWWKWVQLMLAMQRSLHLSPVASIRSISWPEKSQFNCHLLPLPPLFQSNP